MPRVAHLGLGIALLSVGCAGPTLLTTAQVWAIADLPPGQARTLTTESGPVELSGDVPIKVWTRAGPLSTTPLSDLTREGDQLVVQGPAGPTRVDHQALEGGEVVTFSQGRKVALTTAAVVGSALIYVAIAAAVFAARPSN